MRDLVVDFVGHPTTEEVLLALEATLSEHGIPGATRESILSDPAYDRQ